MKFAMIALMLVALSPNNAESSSLKSVLKPGVHKAEIRAIKANPKLNSIALRMRKSIQKNTVWYRQYTSQYKGKTIPWHKNMGIAEVEYKYFTENEDQLKFKKIHNTKVQIRKTGKGYSISTGGRWKFFEKLGVVVSQDGEQITASVGTLRHKRIIGAKDDQTLTGPWDGVCWRDSPTRGRLSAFTDSFIDICIGKLKNSNKGIILYEARSRESKSPYHNSDFALYFEL